MAKVKPYIKIFNIKIYEKLYNVSFFLIFGEMLPIIRPHIYHVKNKWSFILLHPSHSKSLLWTSFLVRKLLHVLFICCGSNDITVLSFILFLPKHNHAAHSRCRCASFNAVAIVSSDIGNILFCYYWQIIVKSLTFDQMQEIWIEISFRGNKICVLVWNPSGIRCKIWLWQKMRHDVRSWIRYRWRGRRIPSKSDDQQV